MAITAILAATGAVFFTKQQLNSANFTDAVKFVQNDKDAFRCKNAKGQIVNSNDGSTHCAIYMPKYQIKEKGKK